MLIHSLLHVRFQKTLLQQEDAIKRQEHGLIQRRAKEIEENTNEY